MNISKVNILCFCILLIGIFACSNNDYYDGLKAYDAKNYETAFGIWIDLANEGDANSQYKIGQMYEQGLGVPQNYIKAHVYYNLASSQGNTDATSARDSLASKMSKDELAQSRQQASNWEGSTGSEEISPENLQKYGLHIAANTGDFELFKSVIRQGPDINGLDDNGWTPLMYAVYEGNDQIASELLKIGANPDIQSTDGTAALHLSTYSDNLGITEQLLIAGANPNIENADDITPLINASIKKNPKLVKLLIENGADTNKTSKEGVSPLMLAIQNKDVDSVSVLLENGADANYKKKDGVSILDVVKASGSQEIAELLLAQMPDMILEASYLGKPEIIQSQILLGADVNKTNKDGWTPLMISSAEGNLDAVDLLIKNGADVNHKTKNKDTALMFATLGGHEEVVNTLLEDGADKKIKNSSGVTAEYIAKNKSKRETIDKQKKKETKKHASLPKEKLVERNKIREVQRLLNDIGYNVGTADGIIGPITNEAILDFQKRHNMKATELISESLINSLKEEKTKMKIATSSSKLNVPDENYQNKSDSIDNCAYAKAKKNSLKELKSKANNTQSVCGSLGIAVEIYAILYDVYLNCDPKSPKLNEIQKNLNITKTQQRNQCGG